MMFLFRVLLPIICLLLAIACYTFGVPFGGVVFVVFGLIFEGLFWIGIFGRRKSVR